MSANLEKLDVFYGDLTANRAYVYAHLPRPMDDAGLTLKGQVRGPRCLHAQTLPSVAQLVDMGPGPTLLARAAVMEPSYWSPDLPAIYDVTIHLERGNEVVSTARREIGLRSLGTRGNHFALEGKHVVIRGVRTQSTTDSLPRAWHDALASYVDSSFNEESLAEASQWGALSIVEINAAPADLAQKLRQIATYPAVALVVIQSQLPAGFNISDVAPNLLLAQQWLLEKSFKPQPWADVIWVDFSDVQSISDVAATIEHPILAVRPLTTSLPVDQARAACDQLQRDLAPIGQFAGYIV